jgi:hypothetical protein
LLEGKKTQLTEIRLPTAKDLMFESMGVMKRGGEREIVREEQGTVSVSSVKGQESGRGE